MPPNRQQLESALRGAHSAGDEAAAKQIATALRGYSEPAKATQEDPAFDFSAGEMISNIPSSAVEFGKNIVQPFIHPIDTAKSVASLARSGIDKLAQELVQALPEDVAKSGNKLNNYLVDLGIPLQRLPEDSKEIAFSGVAQADQVGKFITDRYGSIDAFKKTAQDDPVGFLSDLSMVLTAGGSAAATLPGKAGKIGQAVKKAGVVSEPINIAKGATKFAASKVIPKTTPVNLFESSAKFSTTFSKEKRTAMAETALKHGVMPTSAGLDKLGGLINDFDSNISTLIDDASKAGKTVPKGAIYKHLKALRRELGGTKIEASSDLVQVNKVAKTIDLHLKKLNKSSLTPNELQTLKTDAYKRVNFDAKQLKSNVGKEAARKAIARGAKEAIEGIVDVKGLNKQLGELLELRDPLSRSAARIENRNVIGIDAPIKIAAGQATGGSGGAATGTALSILEHPKIKAKLAITIKKIQDAGQLNLIDHKLLPTLVHYGLLQSGRVSQLPAGDDE